MAYTNQFRGDIWQTFWKSFRLKTLAAHMNPIHSCCLCMFLMELSVFHRQNKYFCTPSLSVYLTHVYFNQGFKLFLSRADLSCFSNAQIWYLHQGIGVSEAECTVGVIWGMLSLAQMLREGSCLELPKMNLGGREREGARGELLSEKKAIRLLREARLKLSQWEQTSFACFLHIWCQIFYENAVFSA